MENNITMKAQKNEIKLIYNSSRMEEKRAVGYAEALKDHKLQTIDVTREHITETQLAELADQLGVEVRELVDEQSALYKDNFAGKDFEDGEILRVLAQNLEMLKTPIALKDEKAFFVTASYDFIKQDMANKTTPDDGSALYKSKQE
jgi:arsenate reductase-like glutaredoxin family protein